MQLRDVHIFFHGIWIIFLAACATPAENKNAVSVGLTWSQVVYDVSDLDNKPRIKQSHPIQYPVTSFGDCGAEPDEMSVRFVVDKNGLVHDAHVLNPKRTKTETMVIIAIQKWRFETGLKNGKPVAYRMTVPVAVALPVNPL